MNCVVAFSRRRFSINSRRPMVDLEKVLQELRSRKALIERAIAQMEELLCGADGDAPQSRRGRKSMGEAERLQVSARMKSYWESRRKQP
jgi:hypothetical protein